MTTRKQEQQPKERKPGKEAKPDPVAILRNYQRRQTRNNATALIDCFRGLVEGAAKSYLKKLPPNVDQQDLIQAGMFGLIQAARRYDESRGVPFESFSLVRIRGSIQDELRSLDWLPRRQNNDLDATRRLLHLAADLTENMENDLFDLTDESQEGDYILESIYREELLIRVQRSLTSLEWRILHDSYIRGKTLKQVARRLSISPSYVCSLRARIIEKVRRLIAEAALN